MRASAATKTYSVAMVGPPWTSTS